MLVDADPKVYPLLGLISSAFKNTFIAFGGMREGMNTFAVKS